jgi:DNA relaxase NicK
MSSLGHAPPTNRGAFVTNEAEDALRVRIDYLTVVSEEGNWEPWVELLVQLTDGAEVEVRPGRYHYASCYRVAGLIDVLTVPTQPGMPAVCVEARGEGCAWLGIGKLAVLEERADRLTRLDLAVDGAPFSPADMHAAFERGDIRTRALSAEWHTRYGRGRGKTFELGTRHASRQLVAYDRRGETRVELRLRGERADLAREVLRDPAGLLEGTLGLIRDTADFVDRSSATNIGRAVLLDWWDSFVGAFARIGQVITQRTAPSVERRIAWLRQSVLPTLAAINRGGTFDLEHELRTAWDRAKNRHRALTHQARALALIT